MICGRLEDFESLGLDALGPSVRRAVTWIRSLPKNPTEGGVELGAGLKALVLRYATHEEASARFETHRQHVDLQYTLEGCEVLEWAPRAVLAADGNYDVAKDLLFHRPPSRAADRVTLEPGCFALFTPWDAHRGAIRSMAAAPEVLKLVVKIPIRDFAPHSTL